MREDTRIVVLLLSPISGPRRFPEEHRSVYRLARDLGREGITLVPGPPFSPPGFPPLPPDEMHWWEEWEYRLRRDIWFRESDYSLYRWERWHFPAWMSFWCRYLPEMIRRLVRLSDEGVISGILILTLRGAEEYVDAGGLAEIVTRIPEDTALLHVTLGPIDREARLRFPGVKSFNYPDDRSQVLEILTSLRPVARDRFPPASAAPTAGAAAPTTATAPRYRAAADHSLAKATPSDRTAALPTDEALGGRWQGGEIAKEVTAGAVESKSSRPTPLARLRLPRLRLPRLGLPKGRAPAAEEVHLGAAAPRTVCPGEEFVARFAAYTEAHRSEVRRIIAQEAPSAHSRLDLETCRWRPGAKVTVRFDAHYVEVSNPVQTFKWNGAWCVLRFDAKAPVDIEINTIILRFDVAVEGLPIIAIRPEIAVSRKGKEGKRTTSVSVIEQTAPRSAFASYAKKDKRDVLGRVRSLQIYTGIDVFLDCLSIRPGEEWKSKLKNEIRDRDIFWLFWSRSAMASEWVEWEWRTALAQKSLAEIQPHPLEPSELAPPPQELSSLQFGAMYEWYVSQLRQSAITRVIRPLLHKAASLMRRR